MTLHWLPHIHSLHMACLNLLESDAKPKLKVIQWVDFLSSSSFFFDSFGPEFWLLIGDTFFTDFNA